MSTLKGTFDFEVKMGCKCEEYGMYKHSSVVSICTPTGNASVSLSTPTSPANTRCNLVSQFDIDMRTTCRFCIKELSGMSKCTLTYKPGDDNSVVVVHNDVADQIVFVKMTTTDVGKEDV